MYPEKKVREMWKGVEFCKWQAERVLLLLGLAGKYPDNTGGSEIKEMNKINGSASGEVSWRSQWKKGVEVANPSDQWSVNVILF